MDGMSGSKPILIVPRPETPDITPGDLGRIVLVMAAIACVTVTAVLWMDQAGIHLPMWD